MHSKMIVICGLEVLAYSFLRNTRLLQEFLQALLRLVEIVLGEGIEYRV